MGQPARQTEAQATPRPQLAAIPSPSPGHQQRHTTPEPWQCELLSHWPEYAAECAGTAWLLFWVVTVVGWLLADGSPVTHWIPSLPLRLFIVGLILGGAGGVVAISPPGKLSGAHLNPATSLGFWVLGKMQPQDVLGYVVAQCLGAIAGTGIAVAVWGPLARAVGFAANSPGPRVSAPWASLGELGASFAVSLMVFILISHHRLMRWTPAFVTVAIGIIVWLDANFSGASMNPARSLGPALFDGAWSNYWVYVVGPVLGTVVAAAGHRWLAPVEARTGKLFHSYEYRSVFTGASDQAANTHVRSQHGQAAHERPHLSNRRIPHTHPPA